MGKRHCWKCQTRHGKPTGLKCRRVPVTLPKDSPPADVEDLDVHVNTAAILNRDKSAAADVDFPPTQQVSLDNKSSASDLEKRLDSMENLLYMLTENLWPQRNVGQASGRKHRSPSRSSDGTAVDPHRSSRRHSSRESPSRYRYNSDNYFREEESQVNSFEAIMVAVFRTISEIYEEGEDIGGILSHGQYMAEKAAANVYISDAFTGYDRYVRQIASKKGPHAFATVSELERSRYFNLENYREVRAFRARNKAQGNQKSKSATCCHYNGEHGCFARSCQYVHRCSSCETVGHSARECKSGKGDKCQK